MEVTNPVDRQEDPKYKLRSQSKEKEEDLSIFQDFPDFQELFVHNGSLEIIVRMEDYKCLHKNQLITNTVLDFYLQYIQQTWMTDGQRDKVYIFSSNFYSLYAIDANFPGWREDTSPASEKRYKRVQGLLPSDVCIFEKDFLVIPCLDKEHWFLVIVCYPSNGCSRVGQCSTQHDRSDGPKRQPMILCFDSVSDKPARRAKAITHIRNFIRSECNSEKYTNQFRFLEAFSTCHVKVNYTASSSPEQTGKTDCGLFVMEFVERFFIKDPIRDFRLPINCSAWFDPQIIESNDKRRQIATIIKSLVTKDINLPPISFHN